MKKALKSQLLGMEYPKKLPSRFRKTEKFVMKAEVIEADKKKYLRAVLYRKAEAKYIIFCDREEKDFTTYKIDEEKWSEAMIINLDWSLYYISDIEYADKRSEIIGVEYLDMTAEKSAEAVREFQMRKKKWEYKKRFENSERRTKELMEQVGELPADIHDFIDKYVMRDSRYLYYKPIGKNKIECFCSHCRKTMTIDRPKKLKGQLINQKITCPHCRSKVTLKSQKRAPWMRDSEILNIIVKISEGFIVRSFKVERYHNKDFKTEPQTIMHEMLRNHIQNRSMKTYEEKQTHSNIFGWLPKRWVKQEYNSTYNGYVYFRNLEKILKGTEYQYCALKEYAKKCSYITVSDYFYTYLKHPNIEKLVKLGFISLTKELINYEYNCSSIDFGQKDIYKMLGVSRSDLQELRKLNPNYYELEFWRIMRENREKPDINRIRKIGGLGWCNKSTFETVLKYTKVNRFIRYAEQQILGKRKFFDVLNDWNDYIRNAVLLRYDLRDTMYLFPNDLKKAHDTALEKVKLEKDKLTSEAITRIYQERFPEYAFQDKNFFVTMPADYEDLAREGKELHHCVATYAARIAEEECIIVFIRKVSEPDKPFYTAEIRGDQVWQLRGLKNCSATPEVEKFFEKYKKLKLNQKNERKAV